MESKRLYPSSQMVLYLAPNVLKTLMWVLGWQGKTIVYYDRQYSKALRMEIEEVERCLQALFDKKFLTYKNVDGKWVLEPVAETFQKYYEVPISKVIESGKTLEMAEKATWNVVETKDDESDEELQRQILMLQAMLSERKQVRNKVVSMAASNDDNYCSDLPF